jgi:hypothetical protein
MDAFSPCLSADLRARFAVIECLMKRTACLARSASYAHDLFRRLCIWKTPLDGDCALDIVNAMIPLRKFLGKPEADEKALVSLMQHTWSIPCPRHPPDWDGPLSAFRRSRDCRTRKDAIHDLISAWDKLTATTIESALEISIPGHPDSVKFQSNVITIRRDGDGLLLAS